MRLSKFKYAKRALLVFALAAAALCQTESQIESDDVKRVGNHLACQCGACSENVNCNMSSGQCHFCKPTRTQIFKLQQQGMNDSGIIASFVNQYGKGIFRADPNSSFTLVPWLAIPAGILLIWFVLRRMMGPSHLRTAAAGPAVDNDPVLARYRERIEKDTDTLE